MITIQELQNEIDALEERLQELNRRLPAHSIPPAMIAELDELDEELSVKRARLAELLRKSDH
jgi:Tfp pilus assembly protein PilO